MRAPKLLQLLTLVGGPAVLASLLGYTYLTIASSQGGLWLGADWHQDKLRILVCGAIGLAIAVHTTIALALPVLVGAVTPDAGRLALGLTTTRPIGQSKVEEATNNNLQSWAALVLGAPTIAALLALRPFGVPFGLSLGIGAGSAMLGLSWMIYRLHLAGWKMPWRAIGWLAASIAFCVLVAISIFFIGLQVWNRGYLEASWVQMYGQVGWAIAVTAICTWLFSPADRNVMKRRVGLVFAFVLLASLSTSNSLKIVDTTLAVAARGGEHGVLVARSAGSPLDLPAAACANPACTQSVPVRVVGYVGGRIIFWFLRPLGDGLNAMEWDDVPSSHVRLQRDQPDQPSRATWLLF